MDSRTDSFLAARARTATREQSATWNPRRELLPEEVLYIMDELLRLEVSRESLPVQLPPGRPLTPLTLPGNVSRWPSTWTDSIHLSLPETSGASIAVFGGFSRPWSTNPAGIAARSHQNRRDRVGGIGKGPSLRGELAWSPGLVPVLTHPVR